MKTMPKPKKPTCLNLRLKLKCIKSILSLGVDFMRLGLGLKLRRLGRWVSWIRHRFHALRHCFHVLRCRFSCVIIKHFLGLLNAALAVNQSAHRARLKQTHTKRAGEREVGVALLSANTYSSGAQCC